MAKCFRCGKSTALRGTVKLKDEVICGKCAKDLGMDKTEILVSSQYRYDDIKDGMDVYYKKQMIKRAMLEEIEERKSRLVSNYGQERELVCTEEERQIFDLISDHFPTDELRLVRVSDDYVTIKRNEWDIARIKYTNRAKWIILPCIEVGSVKHKIQSVDDCAAYFDQIRESIEKARKSEV